MLIVAIAERPSLKSFGIVPFIVRTDEGRLLVAGHPQGEIDEEYLQGLFRSSIGAHDVSTIGARIIRFDPALVAGWVGERFVAECARLQAPAPEHPEAWYVRAAQGCFWIGSRAGVHAYRQRWVLAAGQQAIRARDRALAKLMLRADPWAPEYEAAIWYTCDTEEEREIELSWFFSVVVNGRCRTREEIEAEIHATIARLKAD